MSLPLGTRPSTQNGRGLNLPKSRSLDIWNQEIKEGNWKTPHQKIIPSLETSNQVINYLKENYPLPNKGILAGGSLGNLIWEYKSGNKAVINDIDVFILDKRIEIEDTYPKRDSNGFSKKPDLVIENITHPYEDMIKKNKDSFYQITSTDQIGFINYINYDSNKEGISNIINAFDFNCTQVGYDLATNDFLWTKEFEVFINTGKILYTNLQSPCSIHSVNGKQKLSNGYNRPIVTSYYDK